MHFANDSWMFPRNIINCHLDENNEELFIYQVSRSVKRVEMSTKMLHYYEMCAGVLVADLILKLNITAGLVCWISTAGLVTGRPHPRHQPNELHKLQPKFFAATNGSENSSVQHTQRERYMWRRSDKWRRKQLVPEKPSVEVETEEQTPRITR